MSYFKPLFDLPVYDLYAEYCRLVKEKIIPEVDDQMCINTVKEKPDDVFYGRGSLYYNWDNKKEINGKIEVPLREIPLKETDFDTICSPFKGTLFEEVFNSLSNKYKLGRVRIMKMRPKTCLTWHQDDSIRVHFPMKTTPECMMIIEDHVKHLPEMTWWETNTLPFHTTINAGIKDRFHLVSVVL
jgi:hypothetical protein